MCVFDERVHNCGHYHKTLTIPCKEAKNKKVVCTTEIKIRAVSTGKKGCDLDGCDQTLSPMREGPSKYIHLSCVSEMHMKETETQ